MSRRAPLLLLSFLLSALPAAAQFTPQEKKAAKNDPKMYTLDELSVKVSEEGPAVSTQDLDPTGGSINDRLVVIDHIINTGKDLWKFLDENTVVKSTTQFATALPQGIRDWTVMEGWKPPQGKTYRLTAKNLYGMTMVDVKFMVLRNYGGSYEGKGHFLTAVNAQAIPASSSMGYRVSLEAGAPPEGIVNAGTKADPVAGMEFIVGWSVETAVKKSHGSLIYYLDGNGAFQQIGGQMTLKKAEAAVAGAVEENLKSGS